jgi:PilZ domain
MAPPSLTLQAARIPASGEKIMNSIERRVAQRVNVRVPLRFRLHNIPNSSEHEAESENISQRGLYFQTEVPLEIGTLLAVTMRIAKDVAGKFASDIACMARVVRVQTLAQGTCRWGIGLHIERYEINLPAGDRWAN